MRKQYDTQTKKSNKKLCQMIDEYKGKGIKVLFRLEKESCMNWIIVIHFIDILRKKYPEVEFYLGVSKKFEYFTIFDPEIIKVITNNLKESLFEVNFKLPVKDIAESLRNNKNTFQLFHILNEKYIGLNRFMLACPCFEFDDLNRDYSDKVFFNLEEDDIHYKKILNEIKKCSFKVMEFKNLNNDIIEKQPYDKTMNLNLVSANANSVTVTSNGFINYISKFDIMGNDKVEGKIIPSESIVLRYKNDNADLFNSKKNIEEVHKLTGSGMIEYSYIVELTSDSIIIKLNLDEFKLRSGFSKNMMADNVLKNKKNKLVEVTKDKRLFIEELKNCRYYIGKEDVYFLLAAMVLGTDNCILLDKRTMFNLVDVFPYFSISNIIDLEAYRTGMIEDKLEELQLKG